jgi:hypothetical protein
MTTPEILAALVQISDRIDAAFDEAGDKYATDRHACLEQVGDRITGLMAPHPGDRCAMTTPTSYTATPALPKTADLLALVTLEYQQLKDEQRTRITARDGLIYATLASVAGVLAAGVKTGSPLLLLVLPPAVLLLGWTYLANDRKVTEIGAYIRTDLATRARVLLPGADPFGWETHHRIHTTGSGRRGLKVGQLAVDLIAFCLPAIAAPLVLVLGPWPTPAWAIATALAEVAAAAVLADQIACAADLACPADSADSFGGGR